VLGHDALWCTNDNDRLRARARSKANGQMGRLASFFDNSLRLSHLWLPIYFNPKENYQLTYSLLQKCRQVILYT